MPIRFEPKGPLALITIDRPEAMNSLDPETNKELIEAWKRFGADEALAVAVLTGAGERAFCAGVDIKRLDDWYASVPKERRREIWNREPGLGGLTRNLDVGKPVVAAINGHCLGGGLELALACDIRIASSKATLGLPEARWGILPGQGGTQRLPRAIAPNLALEMILTGEPITAQRAYEIGLVNRVVEPAAVLPEAIRVAELIARHNAETTRRAREAILRGLELPLSEGLRMEQDLADPLRDKAQGREKRREFGATAPAVDARR